MRYPTINFWSFRRAIPQILVLAFLTSAGVLLAPASMQPMGAIVGAGAYLLYSNLMRRVIPRAHIAGMKAFENKEYETAVKRFRESIDFFAKHSWIDRFRSLVLMSPSIWSYREMAHLNIATSQMQLGQFAEARKVLDNLLNESPNNELAVRTRDLLSKIDASQTTGA